jgi:L,D-peptidoglycan transpeptidase YkuD (ErfK/YbiS/YcfS/YnhG family)
MGVNPKRVPGAGSAFFLHVSSGRPTAGCVAVPRSNMVDLLRWLKPGALIAIKPRA